ncbi:MAG: hypothetical protein JWM98_126, partial [Thermoleophilia bacterium]|nr:hypothetical protein [Thermoleophilia bacterium]
MTGLINAAGAVAAAVPHAAAAAAP